MLWKKNGVLLLVIGVFSVVFFNVGVVNAEQKETVVFEVDADTPVVQIGEARKVVVRALVRPYIRRETVRAPLAVALVLDKSGSMASDGKMDNAKRGALEALKMLDSKDVATIIVYDDRASVLVRARSVGNGAKEPAFLRAISRVHAGGMTALHDGVVLGAEQLEPFVDEGFIPRIVLLSDGIANVGPSSTEELARLGRGLARREMTITTIGLGLDYHEDLMTALAAESGGNAYFARNARMLPEIFTRDMEDAVTLTARKVRISLRALGGARPARVIGRPGNLADDLLEASIDNLYSGEKYALFEMELPEGEEGTQLEAAEVVLEYIDPVTGGSVRKSAPLTFSFTTDGAEVEKHQRTEIISQVALARNAEIREEAVRLADEGKAQEAAQMLGERTKQLRMLAPSVGSAAPQMEKESGYFEDLAENLLSTGGLSNVERKEVLNDAYMQKTQQTPVEVESGDLPKDTSEDEPEDEKEEKGEEENTSK